MSPLRTDSVFPKAALELILFAVLSPFSGIITYYISLFAVVLLSFGTLGFFILQHLRNPRNAQKFCLFLAIMLILC